jgi:hypothetical protein
MLEWLVDIIKSLCNGKFTGSIQIRFKNGGISSITKPKGKTDEVKRRPEYGIDYK